MDNEEVVIEEQPNNPLHGVKLSDILDYLVENIGWKKLSGEVNILCFSRRTST